MDLVLSPVSRLAARAGTAALGAALAAVISPAVWSADNPWFPATMAQNVHVGAVWSFAAQPENPLVVLAATQDAGLLRSTDGGAHWEPPAGAPTKAMWVVAFDPYSPRVAYAGSQGAGLFKSVDAGLTWAAANSGLPSSDVRAIDFGQRLVAVATGKGVYISQDAGNNWYSQGLSEFSVSAVSVFGKNPPYGLLAGVDNAVNPKGYLFKNANLSATWLNAVEVDGKKTGFPVDALVSAVVSGPLPSGASIRPVMIGTQIGTYRTDDGGSTFALVSGLPNLNFNAIAFNPNSADQVFVASDGGGVGGGVFRSADRGASWAPIGNGLPSHQVVGLGISAAKPAQVLVGLWDPAGRSVGLYRYPDAALVSTPGAGAAPSQTPAATSSARPKAAPALPAVRSAPVDPRLRLAGFGLLAAGGVGMLLILIRRRRMAREDRLTRE